MQLVTCYVTTALIGKMIQENPLRSRSGFFLLVPAKVWVLRYSVGRGDSLATLRLCGRGYWKFNVVHLVAGHELGAR